MKSSKVIRHKKSLKVIRHNGAILAYDPDTGFRLDAYDPDTGFRLDAKFPFLGSTTLAAPTFDRWDTLVDQLPGRAEQSPASIGTKELTFAVSYTRVDEASTRELFERLPQGAHVTVHIGAPDE